MTINNPGNTGIIDGLIRSYTGGILGGSAPTAGSGMTGQGIQDQVIADGSTAPPPVLGATNPLATLSSNNSFQAPDSTQPDAPSFGSDNTNPYKPDKGTSWDATDAGKARATSQGSGSGIMSAVGTLPASNQGFQTGDWRQYLPQNLKSYATNAVGNYISSGINSLFGGSSPPATTGTITSGEDL